MRTIGGPAAVVAGYSARLNLGERTMSANVDLKEQIEVTPETIRAGVTALYLDEVRPWRDEAEVAAKIYRAMANLAPYRP
jgi:hypothetical protein